MEADIAPVAALLADRTRAAMLDALMDGEPHRAGELGWSARLTIDQMCRDAWRWQSQNPDGYAT